MAKDANSWDVPIQFLDDEIERMEVLQRESVVAARAQGASWESIASVFGVSRQAVQQRFGRYCQ